MLENNAKKNRNRVCADEAETPPTTATTTTTKYHKNNKRINKCMRMYICVYLYI